MKAVRLHEYHQQPVVEEVPEPTVKGPLDVVVKIGGAGVCRTDLHIILGQWAEAIERHAALHHRARERRLGARGRLRGDERGRRRHGDPASDAHLRTVPGLSGRQRHALQRELLPRAGQPTAGWPSYLLTSARACVKLDPETRPKDVAALADAGITAYHAVRKAIPQLYPGTTCAVIGAGGLGHIGIQCLAALTATNIIVVDRHPDALKLAEQLGAHHTVLADGGQVDAVKELTERRVPTWCSTSSPRRERRTKASR